VRSAAAHLTAIQDLADEACACPDRRCLAAIDLELAELVRALELVPERALAPAQAKESFMALERLSVCMTDRKVATPAFGHAIVERYAELAPQLCACLDDACATTMLRTLPEAAAAAYFPMEDREWEAFEDAVKRVGVCRPETAPARAIRELTALRDAACACPDADCAGAVQRDFDRFLADHEKTQGSPRDVETIRSLAGEMAACLASARGQ
jgi:hypothetical protein